MISRHSWPVVVLRTAFVIFAFIFGTLGIRLLQELGGVVFSRHPALFHACVALTKSHFLALLTFLTALVNPTAVSVTWDARQMSSSRFEVRAGHLHSTLADNAVWISNHQIYTDWLFWWFLAYTGGHAGAAYIVLKENLAKIPVLGPGMRRFRFMFLSRKWATDKLRLTSQLLELDANARGMGPVAGVTCAASESSRLPGVRQWPPGHGSVAANYHLIVYPEGTVMSPHTRERSDKFCASINRPPLRHVLLPRARGLFLMLRSLRGSVDVVYDLTTGYTGLGPEQYGEEVFTLKAYYLFGYGPRKINFAVRTWNLADIPLGPDDGNIDVDDVDPQVMRQFEEWLYDAWYAKDELMSRFFATGSFEGEETKTVEAPFQLRSPLEALAPFVPSLTLVLMLYLSVRLISFAWSLL
ncbi:putative uncharacterized acyltransferase [Clavispora lusitaniae]|uniref:Uncharacterized acyltransferase n=1 Tax=Clavispora lusitaniae TaxID=36911 RepID=A0ACD0WT37_CLALS|nr:Acyltransferase family protein [Clavispora lusitaniae]QFZ30485.1 putative uncharacterized acyltransferase [Clavispora lusitaniae]QFZ36147.1 putative uncharacterized acyltransferase [Clavispora lusitaniae]QFZ41831.1 putative uncharacterized acyltransferase [Clavispora lusitaniae]QFZ47507.1 putative uncharacterized acyltransferase [Clavispora lusitaniae]